MVLSSTPTHAQCQYEVTPLPIPDCGLIDPSIYPADMNNAGVVVGGYDQCDMSGFAIYRWHPDSGLDTSVQLPPGATSAFATAINDLGNIAGCATSDDGEQFGWILINGEYQIIGLPNGLGPMIDILSLNNSNTAVGWLGSSPSGERHAFRWNDGELTLLDSIVGSTNARAVDINDSGSITGNIVSPSTTFVIDDEGVTFLPVIDCDDQAFQGISEPFAIGPDGTIVGTVTCQDFLRLAVSWQDGEPVDLGGLPEFPGDSFAYDVNRYGTIVGGSVNGWIWLNGQLTDLQSLSGAPQVGSGTVINDQHEILVAGDGLVLRPADSPNGDLTADCRVDMTDLAQLLAEWGSRSDAPADIDGNGMVGSGDLAILLANWTG